MAGWVVGAWEDQSKMDGPREWQRNLRLTSREREILTLLFEGRTNREIAYILNLSPLTVRGHMTRPLRKVRAQNRTDLLAMLVDHHRRQRRRLRP